MSVYSFLHERGIDELYQAVVLAVLMLVLGGLAVRKRVTEGLLDLDACVRARTWAGTPVRSRRFRAPAYPRTSGESRSIQATWM